MSIVIQDPHGEDVSVNLQWSGGIIDAEVRATDEATFVAAALDQGLYDKEMQTVVDEDGVETEEPVLDEDGNEIIRPAAGVNVSVIGPVVIIPASYDDDGVELIPATFDERYHVNLRITGSALTASNEEGFHNWKTTAILWTENGVEDTEVNNHESSLVVGGVGLIDPESIDTPQRVWL
jgi:hypothetical protein